MMNTINRKNTIIVFFSLLILLFPVISTAAEESGAEIVYFENPDGDLIITDSKGEAIDGNFGVILPVGAKIETGGGVLELKLVPNGSILKISSGSSFELRALQSEGGSKANIFALLRGKLRTLAARGGRGEQYTVQTPSAVAAVRGTEFMRDISSCKVRLI